MGCRMHTRSLAFLSSADSVASEAPNDDELCLALASLPSEFSVLSFSLVYVFFSVHSNSLAHMNVNLPVVELEHHIYGMMDVGQA